MGRLNPSRETKFSGTHGDRGMFIFPVQLTTSRIVNLTRLIHTLLYVITIHTYYIHTYSSISDTLRCEFRPTKNVRTDTVIANNGVTIVKNGVRS